MANTWQRRATGTFTCQSGNTVTAHRAGPSLALKAQRFLPILQKVGADGEMSADEQLAAILALSDEELDRLTDFARMLICDAVDAPVISLTPKEGQYHPDDLPLADFWELFVWISKGCRDIPVPLTEGETTIDAVSSFPSRQGAGADVGEDSPAM